MPPVLAHAPIAIHHLDWASVPHALDHTRHLVHAGSGDDHQVGLPRRETHHFGAEPRDIEAARAHGHQFNGATGQPIGMGQQEFLRTQSMAGVRACDNEVAALNLGIKSSLDALNHEVTSSAFFFDFGAVISGSRARSFCGAQSSAPFSRRKCDRLQESQEQHRAE